MNWTIYALEYLVAIILFTCAIMILLCRDPVWWIHDYPEDINDGDMINMTNWKM